ncbi:MAG: aldolase/citrate lyase family protein [Woeseiaceae bacterium]
MSSNCASFRERLRDSQTLIGTFMKTPSPIVAEVLGLSSLNVVCIDTEHAPFGRLDSDLCIAAYRAADMPSVVRVASDSPHDIRNALDSGATGIVVPHVTTVEQATAIVKAAHFGEGGRGYAGSPRAAGYTTRSMRDHLSGSSKSTTIILQIEDPVALANVEAIAAVAGVDALFVGRADLAVAMQQPVSSKVVIETVERICRQARDGGAAVGMFTPNLDEIPTWIDHGASLFLLSSDQSLLLAGANQLAAIAPD